VDLVDSEVRSQVEIIKNRSPKIPKVDSTFSSFNNYESDRVVIKRSIELAKNGTTNQIVWLYIYIYIYIFL